MFLYYDRVSDMLTLETEEEVVFLGPLTHALVRLRKEYDLTDSQAREAVLQSVFNQGAAVDLDIIKRIATDKSQFFWKNERRTNT